MCAYDNTHLQLGRKHESKDAERYTYETQTVKPVFMADTIVSVTELIAVGHCVFGPHVAREGFRVDATVPELEGQALWDTV